MKTVTLTDRGGRPVVYSHPDTNGSGTVINVHAGFWVALKAIAAGHFAKLARPGEGDAEWTERNFPMIETAPDGWRESEIDITVGARHKPIAVHRTRACWPVTV